MSKLVISSLLLAILITPVLAQTDINVLYIQKTPLLNYDSTNGGWPLAGSTVTWNAKVKNWGPSTLPSFACEWWLDGQLVQTDTINNLASGETRNVTYSWSWQQSPHTLEFRADTGGVVAEVTESNNVYTITTNAITVGSWVEQSLYDWFHAHQIEMGDGANSFDDWCYRMVKRWNVLFERAVWPASPNGVVDRVRMEKIVVVPDGALPLNGGLKTNNPDRYDKTVDLMWGHPYIAADIQPGGYWQVSSTGPFFIDYGEIHELNHARYLVDHYGFDVNHDQTTNNILVTGLSGGYVAGTPLMPYSAWNVIYYNKSNDFMGGASFYGEYGAGAWNRKAGIRGPSGNQNSPGDIGVYMQDLPQNNYFKFVDNTGAPIVGATVYVFRATGGSGWYAKYYDGTADLTLTTNAEGVVNLGRCPFSANGVVTNTYGLSNATFIIRLVKGAQEYFTFGEVSDFGINYWRGNTSSANYTVTVPWGAADTSTQVGPNSWRQEIFNGKTLSSLVDVKSLDVNNLGGFVLRMADRPISSAVGRDNFSCRFTRDAFFNKGSYKFIMHTDDGGRLYIDGASLINRWTDGGAIPEMAVAGYDTCALRSIRMDYYEAGSVAIAALAIIPPLDTVPGPDDWKMDIYNTTSFTGLVESAACPAAPGGGVALDWGERGPSVRTGGDGWSVRFTRTFHFAGGNYALTTLSDDGVRLYVDGVLKIDNWSAHPVEQNTVQVALTPGDHTLVLETYDASGTAQISLSMEHLMPDFDVTFISRTPRYDRYNVSYEYGVDPGQPTVGRPYLTPAEQAKQRWPMPGELVTYTAHVRNNGVSPAACDYRWTFDGNPVGTGTTAVLQPGEEATATYSRPWDSELNSHEIEFSADPLNSVPERCESNNWLVNHTNALSFRLHVWQSVYDWFLANAGGYGDLASFEDWAQINFSHLNTLLATAIYPGTPQGVPERLRIDEVVVVPDSTPDPDPITHAPEDWPWDGRLGFLPDLVGVGGGANYFEQNPAYVGGPDPALLRRIAPQLGLVDYDALTVPKASNLAAATVGHLSSLTRVALTTGGAYIAEHEAYALTAAAHKRRGFSGGSLYDVPDTVRLQVIDAYRRPLPGAEVRIHQLGPDGSIASAPLFTLTADAQGIAVLPDRNCFGEFTTATGHTLRDNPFGLVDTSGRNGLLFAQVTSGSAVDNQFIELPALNVAHSLGYTDEYTYPLQANVVPEGRPVTNDLYAVKMLSDALGYASGATGKVLRYNGAAWQTLTSPGSATLFALDVSPDGSRLIVCGTGGKLYVYNGTSWSNYSLGTTDIMYACAALSNTTFLVGGLNAKLLRTTNGGANWSAINVAGLTGAVRSIRFINSGNGILTTSAGATFYSTDAGLTWSPSAGIAADEGMLTASALHDGLELSAAGNSGFILTGGFGGTQWSTKLHFPDEQWFGLGMFDPSSGWAVGNTTADYASTTVKRSRDGRWQGAPLITSGSFANLYGVSAAAADDAWAVGKGGMILRLGGDVDIRSSICDSLEQMTALPDGSQISLTQAANLYITASLRDCVYLENAARTMAVKVYTGQVCDLHAHATATGILDTENGERVLRFGEVAWNQETLEIRPFAMQTRSVGGAPNWAGAANLGLLVKTAGRVTGSGPGWVVIDDGSGLIASDGNPGIKVTCEMFGLPEPLPEFYLATGVATTEAVNGVVYPVIRARFEQDLVLHPNPG